MAKKTAAKKKGKSKSSKAAKATSFSRIVRAIEQTENRVRKSKLSSKHKGSRDSALTFLDAIRKEVAKKCVPAAESVFSDKHLGFWKKEK